MSSAPEMPLWRSSSVRATLLLTLIIWLFSAALIITTVALSERTLLQPLTAEVDGELEFFSEQLKISEFELFEWYGEELEDLYIDVEEFDGDNDEQFGFLQAYERRIVRRLNGNLRHQRAAQARLWILGLSAEQPSIDRPFQYYAALIFDEVPEQFHETISDALERAEDTWPERWRWSTMTLTQRSDALLRAISVGAVDRQRCLIDRNLKRDAGAARFGSIGFTGFSAIRVTRDLPLGKTQRWCWVRELTIADGPTYLYGIEADNTLSAVNSSRRWRNIGVFGSFVFAIVIGGSLGRRLFARLRSINQLTERVRAGDLEHRLRISGRRDDFDRLSQNINAMLDKISQLMRGVREVSDNIAHDLRSPLTRLRNRIEQLQQNPNPSADDIAPIAEQADEVLKTFSSLLRIAQLDQGAQRQSFDTIDLKEIIREVGDLYEPVFTDADIQLLVDVPPKPALITGDRHLWSQVFINLLENALRYASNSANVLMRLTPGSHQLIVEIRDQGNGVPEHALSRLTDRFFRGERHRESGGTGLGLSLVAAICRIHDARIDFQNDGGLVVTIHINARQAGS
ncbi:MAG: HAMP domain-containing sensor histidine kinase [Pseudomonadota bacterium]